MSAHDEGGGGRKDWGSEQIAAAAEAADRETTRYLAHLQAAVRLTGATQFEVDARMGRRKGFLSHIFQQHMDLKMVDLFRTLAAIEADPRLFFQRVTGWSEPAGARARAEEAVRRVIPPPRRRLARAPDREAPPQVDEDDPAAVQAVIDRVLPAMYELLDRLRVVAAEAAAEAVRAKAAGAEEASGRPDKHPVRKKGAKKARKSRPKPSAKGRAKPARPEG